ncbi:hypothetical protein [Simiduia aestuariiviva]|uniref:Uncharacterized protein n=1 Tax=Simiduia aestuariiviva TaxID=1510459 RepID=A0A839UHI2_9GAMM|nr:hypothetical protein [Simiduia aestuariiviva]MBB3167322.1 hypothetical protein [Simiduia aestuariiviva]
MKQRKPDESLHACSAGKCLASARFEFLQGCIVFSRDRVHLIH